MAEAIPVVYEEDGLIKSQMKELSSIVNIGSSDKSDVARKHDKYLY